MANSYQPCFSYRSFLQISNPVAAASYPEKVSSSIKHLATTIIRYSDNMDSIGYKVNNNSTTSEMGRNVLGMKTLQEILQISDSLNAEVSFLQLFLLFSENTSRLFKGLSVY